MRIDKVLSNLKYGSRKDVSSILKDKRVKVNNKLITDPKYKVSFNDEIKIDDQLIYFKELIILAINKPKGYLSANKDNYYKVVTDLIKEPYNRYDLHIAGRLDLDSTGLLILTNSGKLIKDITSPNNEIEKEYEVTLDKDFIHSNELLEGVLIKDGKKNIYLAKALKIVTTNHKVLITISEGKFHQVKRMFRHLGYEVISLKRIRINKYLLPNNLEEGQYIEINISDIML